jgi:hypothetical protein
MSQDLITNLYNAFDPDKALPAGDPVYVDLKAVRGDSDIIRDFGHKILRSPNRNTCQLYVGHRGGGKSTELLRLKAELEKQGCFVVYFAADEGDIDKEDAQYTDILIACTRHLLKALKDADTQPLFRWIEERWRDLEDIASLEITVQDLKVENLIPLFAKLSANIRAIPTERAKIREKLNPHTVTLLNALNLFIEDGKRKLTEGKTQLVIIADNLDRIAPVLKTDRTNHDEIFLDRANQLKGLACHIIYTIPISLAYSIRATELRNLYDGDPLALPMVMVQQRDGYPCPDGLALMKKVVEKRVRQFSPTRSLETEVFENTEVLERLCLMSGGHMRNLMFLIESAIDHVNSLPITTRAAQRAITQARDVFRSTVEDKQWEILADVYRNKVIKNNDEYRKLLFNHCILQYVDFDEQEEMQRWYDVHPLILGIQEFKKELEKSQNLSGN